MIFENRREAGRKLATQLTDYIDHEDVIVLALPRGGVPVAFEVAEALNAPLDVFVVRKLGVPGQKELAMGAIASGGVLILNDRVVRALQRSDDVLADDLVAQIAAKEREELVRRERAYRNHRPVLDPRQQCVILVDDGLATGATMLAAVEALRKKGPARIVIAVPTAARPTCERLRPEVDELVCVETPEPFDGVGQWYRDFRQTSDAEVRDLLERAHQKHAGVHES